MTAIKPSSSGSDSGSNSESCSITNSGSDLFEQFPVSFVVVNSATGYNNKIKVSCQLLYLNTPSLLSQTLALTLVISLYRRSLVRWTSSVTDQDALSHTGEAFRSFPNINMGWRFSYYKVCSTMLIEKILSAKGKRFSYPQSMRATGSLLYVLISYLNYTRAV